MCSTDDDGPVAPAEALPANLDWKGEVLPREPVDELSVLTVCDNVTDLLLPDEGPATRIPVARMLQQGPMLQAPTLREGKVLDAPLAQHGFSALVEVRKGSQVHRLLFDTGITPAGCVDNLRRLGRDPGCIEAIVCSHGHFDHTTGLSGLIGTLGRANLPALIHPEFWNRHWQFIPGRDPVEIPTTSRRALDDAGFDIIEQRQPSFLYDRSVLVTGEVDRVTGFEKGFPTHQAWRGASWEPRPADPRRSGADRQRRRLRAGRPYRLRTRRGDQHLPLCPAPDRRRQTARAYRRIPSDRPVVRADHQRHRQRTRTARTRRDGPRPLHRLESHPCDRSPPARRVHPK